MQFLKLKRERCYICKTSAKQDDLCKNCTKIMGHNIRCLVDGIESELKGTSEQKAIARLTYEKNFDEFEEWKTGGEKVNV